MVATARVGRYAGEEPGPAPGVGLPGRLHALRHCSSATEELQRRWGAPVVVGACGRPEMVDHTAELLGLTGCEAVFARTVRPVASTNQGPSSVPVAASNLWLAPQRLPGTILPYLIGTNLTLGQVLRLARVDASTRCIEASIRVANEAQADPFGLPSATLVLQRLMLVVVEGQTVAITEETFPAATGAAHRNRRGRGRDADPHHTVTHACDRWSWPACAEGWRA